MVMLLASSRRRARVSCGSYGTRVVRRGRGVRGTRFGPYTIQTLTPIPMAMRCSSHIGIHRTSVISDFDSCRIRVISVLLYVTPPLSLFSIT